MNQKDYEEQLKKAGEFHGEICGGIAIGTKLAMYGKFDFKFFRNCNGAFL